MRILFTGVLLVLLVGSLNLAPAQQQTVSTWITDISVLTHENMDSTSCQSTFDSSITSCSSHTMRITFEINNPSDLSVQFHTPSGKLATVLHEINLENSYEARVIDTAVYTSAVREREFQPGITQKLIEVDIIISEGMNALPLGVYGLGIQLDTTELDQHIFNATMEVTGRNTQFVYDHPVSPSTTNSLWAFPGKLMTGVGIIVLIVRINSIRS